MSAVGVKVAATVSPQMGEAIELLLWQGLHGSTRAEVVKRLLAQAIELNIIRGHLKHDQLSEPKREAAGGALPDGGR